MILKLSNNNVQVMFFLGSYEDKTRKFLNTANDFTCF